MVFYDMIWFTHAGHILKWFYEVGISRREYE